MNIVSVIAVIGMSVRFQRDTATGTLPTGASNVPELVV
jgi:hypothetical protein